MTAASSHKANSQLLHHDILHSLSYLVVETCYTSPSFLPYFVPNNTTSQQIIRSTMAPARLELEDHSRDAAFNKSMHRDSSRASSFNAMLKKDAAAQKAAVDEYFRHWNSDAKVETDADREVSFFFYASKMLPFCDWTLISFLLPNRPEETPMPPLHATTTTFQLTYTSMDGANHSTSAATPMARISTKPLLATSTTSQQRCN